MKRIAAAGLAASLLTALVLPAATASASAHAGRSAHGVRITVVRGGLNAPRHLTITRAGLVVAQAGRGGPSGGANCVTGPSIGGPGQTQFCVGRTGAISLLRGGHIAASVRLPSAIEEDSQEVAGPAAMTVGRAGTAIVMQDLLVNSQGVTSLPPPGGALFGKLLIQTRSGARRVDLAKFAATHPQHARSLGTVPGETAYDSDPFDVAAYRGGFVVADAAANSLLQVSAHGKIRLLARFPAIKEQVPAGVLGNPTPITVKAQATPTSVAVGPGGALYVGLLRGVPSNPGTAYIYRVVPGHRPVIWARGLTAVTDIAFDGHGRLLATEYSTGGLLAPPTVPGALVRVSRHGHHVTTLPVPGLFQATGVAVGRHGAVYVSNRGDSVATDSHPGQVLKITGLG